MTDLFLNGGYWWPKYENKPDASLAFIKKKLSDIDHSIRRCKRKRVAIQAGGNIGFWPLRIKDAGFDSVYSFEADPLTHAALRQNVMGRVATFNAALSDVEGSIHVKRGPNPGRTRVTGDATPILVGARTVDSMGFTDVDLIQLDIEGHELPALIGSRDTITRCQPVIHVETIGVGADGVRAFMAEVGYVLRERIHSDEIYTPRGK